MIMDHATWARIDNLVSDRRLRLMRKTPSRRVRSDRTAESVLRWIAETVRDWTVEPERGNAGLENRSKPSGFLGPALRRRSTLNKVHP